ncbi:MAG: ATP-binding cassette domain-containing protein [Candidatus Ochrobactrum gambitense]|nr:MAG: ATP-binding cassette domain-containing protein [Candidatus Ochrobactrum gambitense]
MSTLDVHHARVHALIGPNGAGKTTVFNLLTKFLQPTSGRDHAAGRRRSPAPIRPRWRGWGLVRSFQISATFPHLTVLDNVAWRCSARTASATQFWRRFRRLIGWTPRADRASGTRRPCRCPHALPLTSSYGRKRALEIATTLALDPKVLLLDEPMAGMGHEDVDTVATLIRRCREGSRRSDGGAQSQGGGRYCPPCHGAATRRDPRLRRAMPTSRRTSACAPPIWAPRKHE